MATKFLEPGGDATFNVSSVLANGLWSAVSGAPSASTDFVHGNHLRSIKYRAANLDIVVSQLGVSDAGTRISCFLYINAFPTGSATLIAGIGTGLTISWRVRISNSGLLILSETTNQLGTGPTLSLGRWYRVSIAYTITSTTVNRFEVFLDGISAISVTNATLTNIGTNQIQIGNNGNNASLEFYSSDHYTDDSNSLTDTGNIWVTAKRPNANGTTNNFNVQIGAGGSGYGSGHSPQVNERPLSTTNGWEVVAAGVTTEEYNIESKSTGDIDISTATIVDYVGWVSAKTLLSETASIIVNNTTSNISLTSTTTLFTKIAGSASYPAGTGTDIGIITTALATTVSLYECGVIVAYIPTTASSSSAFFQFM